MLGKGVQAARTFVVPGQPLCPCSRHYLGRCFRRAGQPASGSAAADHQAFKHPFQPTWRTDRPPRPAPPPPQFVDPTAIAADRYEKWVHVLDSGAGAVRRYSTDGQLLGSWASARLAGVVDIAVGADGGVYAAHAPSASVLKFDPAGRLLATFGSRGGGDGQVGGLGAGGALPVQRGTGRMEERTCKQQGERSSATAYQPQPGST